MYRVVIIEDDPMVRFLDQSYVEKDPRFQVVQTFQDGRAAMDWLLENPVDLLILDVYMPRFNGVEVLRTLRTLEMNADAIMVTAANDTKTVDMLLKLGVVDYLVKPFTQQRFQQALDAYCFHCQAMTGSAVSQEVLDHLVPGSPPVAVRPAATPKGLQANTLDRICTCLYTAPPEGMSSETIAKQAGLSVVTVRHYMNYLMEQQSVACTVNYDTGGRPSRLYRWRSEH